MFHGMPMPHVTDRSLCQQPCGLLPLWALANNIVQSLLAVLGGACSEVGLQDPKALPMDFQRTWCCCHAIFHMQLHPSVALRQGTQVLVPLHSQQHLHFPNAW